jgi:hypothetical protein
VGVPRITQDGDYGLDPEPRTFHDAVAVGVDELHYLRDWWSSSAPKKGAARFSISFARRSSRFSCSKSAIRRAPAVVTPGVRLIRVRVDDLDRLFRLIPTERPPLVGLERVHGSVIQ